ncbi:MAG: hypothetical protein ACOX7C_00025 [Brevefilum sp.]|jgi:hypothetical protein
MTEKIYAPLDPENKRLEAILAIARIVNDLPYDETFKLELFKTIIAKCFD